jgi:hypothetical protein
MTAALRAWWSENLFGRRSPWTRGLLIWRALGSPTERFIAGRPWRTDASYLVTVRVGDRFYGVVVPCSCRELTVDEIRREMGA